MDDDLFSCSNAAEAAFCEDDKKPLIIPPILSAPQMTLRLGGSLRVWQKEALEVYFKKNAQDFLAVATPGAGKTTFALQVAQELLKRSLVTRITIVVPTEHLKYQWADAAARVGIAINPNFKNAEGHHGAEFIGIAVTYAQVANHPQLHYSRTEAARTLVIMDEIHHAGDALSWGDGLSSAFETATRRLALTGTPFRSDNFPIPFVRYKKLLGGVEVSTADYTYDYGRALADKVVRPVIFMAYSGMVRWRTNSGEEMAAALGEQSTKGMTAQAWRTALDPKGQWIPSVLRAADARLAQMRREVPDAGGLVIASDHEKAKAYARQLKGITGSMPTVVLSDDKKASEKIENFSASDQRWMVAVRMVSEGVDVPRLTVGVYATATSTPLFFAQAVGRFSRSRAWGETASIFLPSVPQLMGLAHEMERQRDHVLERRHEKDEETFNDMGAVIHGEGIAEGAEKQQFTALGSQAAFDRVLFDGAEFGAGGEIGGIEEQEFIGIPGLLDAEQVSLLLRERQAAQSQRRKQPGGPPPSGEPSTASGAAADHRTMKELRKKLAKNVSAWAMRTGIHHSEIHRELRKICGGPEVPQATEAQLRARIAKLQSWFVGRK